MQNYLIVPIDLQAICIGEQNSKTSACFMPAETSFHKLPYGRSDPAPYISDNYVNKTFNGALPLEMGIHLHWALPDALTHGNTDKGKITFPDVPNRWYLTRIWIENIDHTNPVRKEKSWVIESNYLTDNIANNNVGSLAIPITLKDLDDGDAAPYAFLGRFCEATTWKEGSDPNIKYLSKLTAIGYGVAHFAAYYPNCRNVFGFHDTLEDLTSTEDIHITYVLTGWHGPLSADPLVGSKDLTATLKKLNWSIKDIQLVPQIDATLYNSVLNDVIWNKNKDYITNDQPKPLHVSVGYNSMEAISALLASEQKNPVDIELLLDAIQLNLADELNKPDGKEKILRTLFQKHFSSQKAGNIWIIKRNGQTVSSLAANVAAELNKLNILEQKYNQACHNLIQSQQQLFADWYNYLLAKYPLNIGNHNAENSSNLEDIRKLINKEIANFPDTQALLSQVKSQQQKVTSLLTQGFSLETIAAPRYWQINDPTLLLSGDDIIATSRYGKDGAFEKDNTLKCRTQNQLLQAVTIPANVVKDSVEILVNTKDIDLIKVPNQIPFANVIQNLKLEACIIGPYQILLQSIKQGGNKNPAILNKIDYLAYLNKQLSNLDTSLLKWQGLIPSPMGTKIWQMPWLPLILQWRVDFHPIYPIYPEQANINYDADFIIKQVSLNPETFSYEYQKFTPIGKPEQYEGSIFLTPQIGEKLQKQLSDYLTKNSDQDGGLTAILDKLKNLHILSQALSGFNQALLMRKQTIQLNIRDPFVESDMEFDFLDKVRKMISDQFSKAPNPNTCFNPIQAGKIVVSQLRLIDVFGRLKDYSNTNNLLKITKSMSLTTSVDSNPDDIVITPKITQASRLLFRWLSATDDLVEMNSHPATSPIFGWILPNFVSHSLGVYSQEGQYLGSLVYAKDENKVLWQDSPFDPAKRDLATIMKDQNPHLGSLSLALLNNGPAYFAQFLEAIERSSLAIIPERASQHNALAGLIGNPLALTRASLKLDLKGISPEINQSWAAFEARIKSGKKIDNGLSKVRFPIQLGNLTDINDGLVGYFIEDKAGKTYQTFYSPTATEQSGVQKPTLDTIALTPDPESNLILTMVVDPRADVHATMGMLPVKSINIALDQYQSVLQNIFITILTAPVLTTKDQAILPIPGLENSEWSWIEFIGQKVEKLMVKDPHKLSPFEVSNLTIKEGWIEVSNKGKNL